MVPPLLSLVSHAEANQPARTWFSTMVAACVDLVRLWERVISGSAYATILQEDPKCVVFFPIPTQPVFYLCRGSCHRALELGVLQLESDTKYLELG